MQNAIKQMLRTPVQSVLIIALIMIVTVMLVAGGNLWVTSDSLSKAYEDDFITIGTVTQKPDSIVYKEVWDAEKKDYRIYKIPQYNRYTTVQDLDFPEAAYILKPEKRGYWGSYVPEYVHMTETGTYKEDNFVLAVEFSPKEDTVPDHSVKIEIKKVWGTEKTMEGAVVWFCDHMNRYPEELEADKTYVALITQIAYPHGPEWEGRENSHSTLEYGPVSIETTLYTPEGQRIEDPFGTQEIYELTEGFYDTPAGQRFLAIADMAVVYFDTQPVVGMNSTDLLMPFYEGSAWVCEGRYPTQEEYEQGSAVCLAPRIFAENNGLSVGDQVTVRLYYTNTGEDAAVNFGFYGGGYSFNLLGSDGKLLEPFEEKEYTIVGIYDYAPSVSGIARDELIVPLNSVEQKFENLVSFGAMSDENTSFQLENGTITDYLEISAKQGADNLIFTFYDRGYSALMEGIQNLKNVSVALLIMGLIAVVILTLQIVHIYITKQKRRLSIERLMGMTGKQCRTITLTGILILLLLGTVPGVAVGTAISNHVNVEDMGQEDFSRKYSNLGLAVETEIDISCQQQSDLAISCIMGSLVIVLGMGISGVKLRNILSKEPLYLLEDSMAGK